MKKIITIALFALCALTAAEAQHVVIGGADRGRFSKYLLVETKPGRYIEVRVSNREYRKWQAHEKKQKERMERALAIIAERQAKRTTKALAMPMRDVAMTIPSKETKGNQKL